MRKRNVLVIITLVFIISIISIISYNLSKDKEVIMSNHNIQSNKDKMLSLLVETTPGSGKYAEATSSEWPEGYTFNKTLSKCENGSEITYNEENNKISVNSITSDRCYVYFDKPIVYLANYITSLYTGTQGENNMYHHDGTITATVANTDTGVNVGDVIDAGDGSYRYAGSSETTNNYVCFGSDAESCPSYNLYRIIGVFDGRVKLIMASFANSTILGTDGDYKSGTSYYWNKVNYDLANTEKSKYHLWSYSELNKTNLNKNFITYLNNINPKWSNMIDNTTWYVGGMTWNNGTQSNAKKAYTYELGANKNVAAPYEPMNAKIGLMYVSDYYYGANSTYWTYQGYNSSDSTKDYRAATSSNWISGSFAWTISPYLDDSSRVFYVGGSGYVTGSFDVSYSIGVRPSFYLKSSTTFTGGSGTSGDPYRVA